MRLVCSYCSKVLRATTPGGRGVSHGMCGECDAYFGRLWGGVSLAEYLDLLPVPVLVVDGDGRVVAASGRMVELLGRSEEALRGLTGGEAMACAWSRHPGGCGKTEHCRECAIRRTVTEVATTGRPASRVRAWLDSDVGRIPLVVSARRAGGFVEVTVDEVDGAPTELPASPP